MRILHIVGSPRDDRSVSQRMAARFIASMRYWRTEIAVDELNVWTTDLLPFDGAALGAKYADLQGQPMTDAQSRAWQQIRELGERFHDAELILLSVPMWNFGIPYRLKHLIDGVTQRGVLFSFDERGLQGLLGGRKMVVAASRGTALGDDSPAESWDHQVAYLRTWARMVGIHDVQVVLNEMTLGGPEVQAARLAQALRAAEQVAEQVAASFPQPLPAASAGSASRIGSVPAV